MRDLITTNTLEENNAARRPLWWVYYMFAQLSGHYAEVSTDITEDFTAASSVDTDEIKIIFAKNDSDGLVSIQLDHKDFKNKELKADLYKIVDSRSEERRVGKDV